MKLIATFLFALALSAIPAAAEEKKSNQSAVKMPKVAKVTEVKAPFDNHWDSSSWEADSQNNFWHTITPTPAKKATKQD